MEKTNAAFEESSSSCLVLKRLLLFIYCMLNSLAESVTLLCRIADNQTKYFTTLMVSVCLCRHDIDYKIIKCSMSTFLSDALVELINTMLREPGVSARFVVLCHYCLH